LSKTTKVVAVFMIIISVYEGALEHYWGRGT